MAAFKTWQHNFEPQVVQAKAHYAPWNNIEL